MESELPEDDDYMVSLSLQFLEKHEHSGRIEDLVAAVMAANQVLNWHLGTTPTNGDRDAFAADFPAWRTLQRIADGLQPMESPRPAEAASSSASAQGPMVHHEDRDVPLASLCREFLKAFQARHVQRSPDVGKRRMRRSAGAYPQKS
jgi:hypothetical protein